MGRLGRVGWIDTLKGALIFLVVLGHALLPAQGDTALLGQVYDLIYYFHMPLFVFVSGLLAKHTLDAGGRLRVSRVVTYIAMGVAYNVLLRLAEGNGASVGDWLQFPSAPWYLISLATWLALVPLFDGLRPWAGVLLATLISLVSSLGESQTDLFALSRMLHFLPYFVAGYYVSVDSVGRLRAGRRRHALVLIGAVVAAACVLLHRQLEPLDFLVTGNDGCDLPSQVAIPAYALLTVIAVALSAGLVAASPERCGTLATMGKRTLQIYVIHRFVREWAVQAGLYGALESLDPVAALLVLVAASVVVCTVASWSGFERVTRHLMSLGWGPVVRGGGAAER